MKWMHCWAHNIVCIPITKLEEHVDNSIGISEPYRLYIIMRSLALHVDVEARILRANPGS